MSHRTIDILAVVLYSLSVVSRLFSYSYLLTTRMLPNTRSPHNGTYRKLVLAFDIGTTYSGISYRWVSRPGFQREVGDFSFSDIFEQYFGPRPSA